MKLVPVPKLDPPVAAAYQLMVPADAVAPNVTIPLPQTFPGVVPVRVGIGLTVIETELLTTGLKLVQDKEDVIETVKTSALKIVDVLYL